LLLSAGAVMFTPGLMRAQQGQFQIEEASITDIHNSIRAGQTTCQQVVQAYLERAKAYNGACTALVTKDGAPVPAATGVVRAGAPIAYPTETVPVSSIFPNFDQYAGPPFEFGRMEPSISDPSAQLQEGMRAGIPDPQTRAQTVTLYIDKTAFRQALEISDEQHITLLLADPDGEIIWRERGPFAPDKGESLARTLQAKMVVVNTAVQA